MSEGRIRLRSAALDVDVLVGRGTDIDALTDRASGIDLLLTTAWIPVATGPANVPADEWLAGYRGGWQVLFPNAGAPSGTWGFHGEACRSAWTAIDIAPDHLVVGLDLETAPIRLTRVISVDVNILTITETATNLGDAPIDVMWVHHPAFGAPFLDRGCVLSTGATEVVADPAAPGNLLAARSRHSWPKATAADGRTIDLRHIPGPDEARSLLAYLGGFAGDTGWAAITNPYRRLGVLLTWPTEVFPDAWLWQEIGAATQEPWNGRGYAVAIEPASTVPAHGVEGARAQGGRLRTLDPHETVSATIAATVFHDDRAVEDVIGRAPVFEESRDG